MSNKIVRELEQILRDRGWKLVRNMGGHTLWEFTNGRRVTIPGSIRDAGCKKANYLRTIKHAEEGR